MLSGLTGLSNMPPLLSSDINRQILQSSSISDNNSDGVLGLGKGSMWLFSLNYGRNDKF